MSKGLLIVVSGPSGVGKGTVLNEVFNGDDNISYSVSCTTRLPRPNEIDGVHYHFISKDEFKKNISDGKMFEYAEYCDNYYGTNAEYVEKQREMGKDVVLEIETLGAMQVMEKCSDAVTVFIGPPSIEVLKKRLTERGTESEEIVSQRIQKAKEELSRAHYYNYTVINGELQTAIDDVKTILRAERIKYKNKNYNFEV